MQSETDIFVVGAGRLQWPTSTLLSNDGVRPSLLTKAAIQAAYSLNVGNLRDTGHSAEATPPAAMADQQISP